MTVQPTLDQIVIEILPDAKDALVIRPFTANPVGGPAYAVIRGVGPGRASEWTGALLPMPPVAPGMRVLVHSGAGTPYRIDGRDVRFIKPHDLMGVCVTDDGPVMETTAP